MVLYLVHNKQQKHAPTIRERVFFDIRIHVLLSNERIVDGVDNRTNDTETNETADGQRDKDHVPTGNIKQ